MVWMMPEPAVEEVVEVLSGPTPTSLRCMAAGIIVSQTVGRIQDYIGAGETDIVESAHRRDSVQRMVTNVQKQGYLKTLINCGANPSRVTVIERSLRNAVQLVGLSSSFGPGPTTGFTTPYTPYTELVDVANEALKQAEEGWR